MSLYIDVLLPLPVAGCFTYHVPAEWDEQATVGCRVVVPFGLRKQYAGVIVRRHDTAPAGFEVKDILAVLDTRPTVLPMQMDLWRWIADYYICPAGDVYKAALPSGLKLESETVVTANPDFTPESPLSVRAQSILDALSATPQQSISQLEKSTRMHGLLPSVKLLLDKGAVLISEELRHTYKPRVETRVRLHPGIDTEERLHQVMDSLRRAPRQLEAVMRYLELSHYPAVPPTEVTRKQLTEQTSEAALQALVQKDILSLYHTETARQTDTDIATQPLKPLNEAQQAAYEAIRSTFREKDVCLLHGVTASGKTEIYIHLIQEAILQGKQVLYLLPEIALTTQITERLRRVFGNRLGVYHSKYPDALRVELWQKQLTEQDYDVVLGVRSSVLLPFRRLGLVIVDEEHESTYKQQDPSPRYHARNTAIMLATMNKAKVLLGTATPSLESWHNAVTGKYGLVQLTRRYTEVQLPRIVPVDIRELQRKKRMMGPFSPLLMQHIHQALEQHEQVILFQNRRGFAPMVECHVCGWVPRCRHCDVSLTYHKGLNQLTCHYCGYTEPVPTQCPACGEKDLRTRGFGTEKIETEVQSCFPEAHVARLDLDTARTRTAYERIIHDFAEGRTDILIGTQMISKGLDFDRVSVVGILNADTLLNYPDFRSYERAYQLMAQVAGRAGRKGQQGQVILQTKSTDHPIIAQVINNDYAGMADTQLAERQLFHYPPFCRLIYVYLKHRDEKALDRLAHLMARRLQAIFGTRVLGPDRPPVARIQSLYIRKLVVKIETSASLQQARSLLKQVQQDMYTEDGGKSLTLYYDVDPM